MQINELRCGSSILRFGRICKLLIRLALGAGSPSWTRTRRRRRRSAERIRLTLLEERRQRDTWLEASKIERRRRGLRLRMSIGREQLLDRAGQQMRSL